MFVTVLHADGGLYEFTQFADPKDEKQTDRGDLIQDIKIGARVLFRRSPPMRDKDTKRSMVEKLYGKVLDVQAA